MMDSEEANRPGAGGGRGRAARRTSSRSLACYFSIGIAAVSCAALLVLVTCRKSPASEANALLDEGLLPKATQGGRGHSSLAAVEARLDRLGERFSGLEGRFDKIKQQERDIKGEQEALSAKETGLRGAMRQTAKEMSALRGRVDSIRARREEKDIFAPASVKHGPSQALVLARKTPAKVSPRPKILDGMPRYAEARGRTAGKAEKVPGYVAKYAKEYEEEARAQQKRYRDHVRVWMKQQRNYVKKEVRISLLLSLPTVGMCLFLFWECFGSHLPSQQESGERGPYRIDVMQYFSAHGVLHTVSRHVKTVFCTRFVTTLHVPSE
jgi:hypothetical protein